MKKILLIILLTTHLAFSSSSDFNIYEEADKLNTLNQNIYIEDPEFKEFDQKIPSGISIAMEKLYMHINRPDLTDEKIHNIVLQESFLSLKESTKSDMFFLEKLEALDQRLQKPRTAEMLALCHSVWGNQAVSHNYLRIQETRQAIEKELSQNNLVAVTANLVSQFGRDATREYVIEMRGLYPENYLATHWPDVTL